MREAGEPQLVFNYCRALQDFTNSFSFSKGVSFRTPKETEAIVPELLRRVWTVDNSQKKLLWEMGQQGGVAGDLFVKIAYEPAYTDPANRDHAARIRVLPLNAAWCMPTDDTEILTRRGWLNSDEVKVGDQTLSLDPDSDELVWADVLAVNVFNWDGPVHEWNSERFSAATTPDHRWVTKTAQGLRKIRTSEELSGLSGGGSGSLVLAGGTPTHFPTEQKYTDEFVELVGWFITEGCWSAKAVSVWQDFAHNEAFCSRIERLALHFEGMGLPVTRGHYGTKRKWRFPSAVYAEMITAVGEGKKTLLPSFLTSLTYAQATLLYNTILDGDGDTRKSRGDFLWQNNWEAMDSFQMLAMLLGKRSHARMINRDYGPYVKNSGTVSVYGNRTHTLHNIEKTTRTHTGKVWCPTTSTGTWTARRSTMGIEGVGKKVCFITGNCFPEFHPHDKGRLIRFKLKYRFWGCVDTDTEALTRDGWKRHDTLSVGDEILTLNPWTDAIEWQPTSAVSVYPYKGDMHRWIGQVDALTTPNHRWLAEVKHGRAHTYRTEREIVFSGLHPTQGQLVTGGGTPLEFRDQPKWADELVETVAWYVTEGWDHVNQTGARSVYLAQKRAEHVAAIRRIAAWWKQRGGTFSEYKPNSLGVTSWYLGVGVKEALWDAAPNKQITPEFLCSLTYAQARLFYETLLDGDGCRSRGQERWTQLDLGRVDGFQMLCAMLGKRSRFAQGEKITAYTARHTSIKELVANHEEIVPYDGEVWCPTVTNSIWMARRNGTTYWTGNTALEGTRQVFTYVELITENSIEEYINDELLDARPNPLGVIPIVHIANIPVSGSPWGLSDTHDIMTLNRDYNEKATDISDIINYHASPVTVITGAKAANLEKGPRKVWALPNKDSQVFNLELGENLSGPLSYLAMLKSAMHEMVGVPEGALGQTQPISNTSGVALAIQYQPMMNKFEVKKTQYGRGFEQINELILLHLAFYEPETFQYDPSTDTPLRDGQLAVLDPNDPVTYQTTAHFQSPLPIDQLIKLNEIMAKMNLGLESKRGALRDLGEEFPDEKLQELFEELIDDTKWTGALDLMKAQIASAIQMMTGMSPDGQGGVVSAGGPESTPAGSPASTGPPGGGGGGGSSAALPGAATTPSPDQQKMFADIVSLAYGTKIPQRRNPVDDGS